MPRPRKSESPFRYFNSSPEVIRLVSMMYGVSSLLKSKQRQSLCCVGLAPCNGPIDGRFEPECLLREELTFHAGRFLPTTIWRAKMGKGILLWLIGIPIPVILILFLIFR